MVFGRGDGQLGVPFIIIKCAAKGPDYTGCTVLSNLVKSALPSGATPDSDFAHREWKAFLWEREIEIRDSKNAPPRRVHYRIPYLRSRDGAVITLQQKACARLASR
jgi:hypothetical protein